jgi:hypothetical protein
MFLSFFPSAISAQKMIHGTVRDAATNETLPSATVQIENSYNGTVANRDGRFDLRLNTLPAVLVVRFIGYETQRIAINQNTPSEQIIRLKASTAELAQVEITAENPAVRIMKRVLEEKQRRQKNLQTWHAEVYNRFAIMKDTAIVGIVERVTDAFWDKEKGMREVVKAKRETENMKIPSAIPAALTVSNLDADNIEIFGFTLAGVTHPNAFDYYIFELIGRRKLDEQTVYDISVTPKDKLQPAFIGKIAILDGDFSLLEADLKPNQAVFFTAPVQSFSYNAKQQFRAFENDFWLPVDYQSSQSFKIGLPGFTLPLFRIEQVSRFTNYEVNIPLPDSLYKDKSRKVRVDSVAVATSQAFKEEGLAVPLTVKETVAYVKIDSTQTLEKSFKPEGRLAKLLKIGVRDEENNQETTVGGKDDKGKKGKQFPIKLSPNAWYNPIEGVHVMAKPSIRLGKTKQVKLYGIAGYGSSLEKWDFGGGFSAYLDKARKKSLKAEYHDGLEPRLRSPFYDQTAASLVPLFTQVDYFRDYFYNQRFEASLAQSFRKNRNSPAFNASLGIHIEKHRDYLNPFLDQVPHLFIREGALRSAQVHLQWGEVTNGLFDGIAGGKKGLALDIEHSNKAWGDFNFTRLQLTGDMRFATIYKRRFNPPVLDIHGVLGTGWGEVPSQRLGMLDGTIMGFSPFGAFKSILNRPLEGDRYWAIFAEHHFRTVPFELLGLRKWAEKGMGISINAAIGKTRTTFDDSNISYPSCSSGTPCAVSYQPLFRTGRHAEIGVSLHSPFGLPVRLDVTKSFEQKALFIGFGLPKLF